MGQLFQHISTLRAYRINPLCNLIVSRKLIFTERSPDDVSSLSLPLSSFDNDNAISAKFYPRQIAVHYLRTLSTSFPRTSSRNEVIAKFWLIGQTARVREIWKRERERKKFHEIWRGEKIVSMIRSICGTAGHLIFRMQKVSVSVQFVRLVDCNFQSRKKKKTVTHSHIYNWLIAGIMRTW